MSDLMKELFKHDANLRQQVESDPPALQTDSPGVNYLFGKAAGMKAGDSMLLYGPPKSGKSLLTAAFIGHLHKSDKTAWALKFDSEFREDWLDHWAEPFGIDRNRIAYNLTNKPEEIFDYIANDVVALIQKAMKEAGTDDPAVGNPIKLIVIDSLASIDYPKEANAEKTTNMVMGDAASYLPRGFKKILPILKKYKISLIACQHIRDNMNPQSAKYNPYTIPGGKGIKHFIEYWMLVEKINSKDSKIFDSDKLDGSGRPIKIGHALRVKMEENSNGPQDRHVEVDLSYTKGLINIEKEVATLAVNMGVAQTAGAWIHYNGEKWNGVEKFAEAISKNPDLKNDLVAKISENDPL